MDWQFGNIPPVNQPQSLNQCDLADLWESVAVQHGNAGIQELQRIINTASDPDYSNGVQELDETEILLENLTGEIDRRVRVCTAMYPFAISRSGYSLKYTPEHGDRETFHARKLYVFLLFVTRLNMNRHAKQGGILAPSLMEEISARLVTGFLGNSMGGGKNRDFANFFVLGTGNRKSFKDKIQHLCDLIQEGRPKPDFVDPRGGDGGLDVVAWKGFSDGQPGKLVIFGQVKTGIFRPESLGQPRIQPFISEFIYDFVSNPLKAFMTSSVIGENERWDTHARKAEGILMDRLRLVGSCTGMPENIIGKVDNWLNKAIVLSKGL